MNCPATPGDDLYIYPLLSVSVARETIPSGIYDVFITRKSQPTEYIRSPKLHNDSHNYPRGYKRRCRAKREILGRDVYRNRREIIVRHITKRFG